MKPLLQGNPMHNFQFVLYIIDTQTTHNPPQRQKHTQANTHAHTDTNTDTHTDTHTNIHTDTQTDTHTETHTDTHKKSEISPQVLPWLFSLKWSDVWVLTLNGQKWTDLSWHPSGIYRQKWLAKKRGMIWIEPDLRFTLLFCQWDLFFLCLFFVLTSICGNLLAEGLSL